ncbi:MAG: DUF3667 domain-containing protein [Winogradskyella sp.]|uniref:DUF3667 domain-containing protein n=1 Tax=Winogradskyella sp. TaxID=1883156 RepID=UPI00385CEB73
MNCKNCHTTLEKHDDYCKNCGGKVIRNRLTIKNLFAHFGETYFNIDNTFLRTFINLFKKPELVIGGYISGVRKRFLNPISYLALAITIGGVYVIVLNKYFPNAMVEMSSAGIKEQEAMAKQITSVSQDYYSLMMVLYIPFYALISRLVFINKKEFNYTEHLVMAMYIVAQFSLVSSFLNLLLLVMQLPGSFLMSFSILFQIGYFGYCYKRLYKLSIPEIMLKTLIFLGILLALMIVGIIILIILGILFPDSPFIQEILESQRGAYEAGRKIGEEAAKKGT